MNLIRIKDNVQQTAEAISSVLGIDVTVTDKELKRIAGTGKYKDRLGERVNSKGIFAYCIKNGVSHVVRNAKEDEVCKGCGANDTCMEYAEAVCPIIIDDNIIGLIGLIAFNEEQKQLLLKNEVNIIDFLEKMASLIAAKLIDKNKSKEIKLLISQLRTAMDAIEKSLLILDDTGTINYYNQNADMLFNISDNKKTNINELFSDKKLIDSIMHKCINSYEFSMKRSDKSQFRGVINTQLFFEDGNIRSVAVMVEELRQVISSATNIISNNVVTEFDNIIYSSEKMNSVINFAKRACHSDSNVLITGESGTGKELFARAIHYESKRKNEPFIAINCSAIPENLFESELFGYEEGAFTGALKGGHPGKLELAHKGTLLLDEIGDMPLNLQPKLLRFLQDNKVMRIGGKSYVDVDVRIVASTNVNLEQRVRNREFRDDLYYRLNVIPISIPPLRERTEDIELLAEYFINKFSKKLNKNVYGIDSAAMNYLKNYYWYGNVRELENLIEYAVNMTDGNYIDLKIVNNKFRNNNHSIPKRETDINEIETIMSLEELEKREIKKAIGIYGTQSDGVNRICEELGIGRATFYRKIKKYNLS